MKTFNVSSEGSDRFGLVALCQRYCDEQWLASHVTSEQPGQILRDQFRRAVLQELELLNVRCGEVAQTPQMEVKDSNE